MSIVASSSYAIVYGTTVTTHQDKRDAIRAFTAVLAQHCGAHLFAVSATGAYMNVTPRPAHPDR